MKRKTTLAISAVTLGIISFSSYSYAIDLPEPSYNRGSTEPLPPAHERNYTAPEDIFPGNVLYP
ncbi:MAG: hypothetical protein K2X28_03025 [Alphaproteobacteria bacterium]|nr:hypothetical protein [Alphaproteobacteria bacterium]